MYNVSLEKKIYYKNMYIKNIENKEIVNPTLKDL
jgi:hypothetical protein